MIVYNIFLDDIREPREAYNYTKNPIYNRDNWTVVRTHAEFVSLLEKIAVDGAKIGSVSFDHDLAPSHYEVPCEVFNDFTAEQLGMEETGLDSARYLTAFIDRTKMAHPGIAVHSMNPVGKERIQQHLMDWMDGHGGNEDPE